MKDECDDKFGMPFIGQGKWFTHRKNKVIDGKTHRWCTLGEHWVDLDNFHLVRKPLPCAPEIKPKYQSHCIDCHKKYSKERKAEGAHRRRKRSRFASD
jgi:hypothetical protein